MDLVVGKHHIEESREGGTRPAHKALAKNRTSVTTLSKEAWDAGQAVVLPHSLKIVARAELTLPKPSRLSMIDRSTAGATDDGERGRGTGFFPFPFFVGAMVTGRGRIRDWIGSRGWSSRGGRAGDGRVAKIGMTVCNHGSVYLGAK